MNRRAMLVETVAATAWLARLRPFHAVLPKLKFGCAAITWNENNTQAIADIAALGYRGIQLRASAVAEWGARPKALAELLAANRLTFVALSSGLVRLDPAFEEEDRELHLRNARFLRDAGGLFLQVIDERPKERAPDRADFTRMGRLLTELGRRVSDLGIQLGYHNHMGSLGESPDEIARVLEASDPRYVKLELDTAHYQQGGGVPARAVRDLGDRLLFLHLKDLEGPLPGNGSKPYRFVELGRGSVDLPGVFAALEQVGFQGWGIVELDQVPTPTGSPSDSARISKQYLSKLGFTF
jgi:inosose dehydratase